ncbi:MAG: prepilin-type N-terminal cleavage/methylation domain-containing protein [Candidatus Omnitrophota bacterium]|nr:MAG: prepilin-type N-terminal cleavage/methylation domain-containing protein [Candidatus Omnitrophota bacterium]
MLSKGFTLLELIIVVVILGIIASMGMPTYKKAVERVRCAEAIAHLKIIQAKEQMEKLEINNYVSCAGTDSCRSLLDLDLPGENWNYSVTDVTVNDFIARANRTFGTWGGCEYTINSTNDIVNNTGCYYSEISP